jgi:alpha-1,6-mannosyltransferase
MHVVDATLFYSPTSGGVKRYLLAKHEWMAAHTNWRHSMLVPGENRTHAPGDISTIAGSLVPGAFNYRLPLNPVRWSRAIDALEPDLIEIGDAFHPAWAAANVANRRGIPLIAFYHSNFPQLAGRRLGRSVQRFIEWYVRLTYERCGSVLAPSRYMCEYLHSIGVAHATVQPLGVDVDTFTPERRGRDLTAELNLPRGTRLLVFAGRFSAEKNIPVLTEAMRRLGDPYHLLLIGGGDAVREGNVTRIPYRRDNRELASYLASSDVFVHAGVHETFGLVVLEAMACGRPVVGMRAGAIPELVDESAGMLAEPHEDPNVAAANLAQAVADIYRRDLDMLGAAARRHVVSNYSWSRALQSLMLRYQSALASRVPARASALARAETTH